MKRSLAFVFTFVCSVNVYAFDYAYVGNMAQLNWQLAEGRVYLRNLNQFNGNFLPCCYNYWVDTTTPGGKSMWSAMLLKIGTGQPLYMGLTNPSQPGQIEHIGNW